MPNMVVNTFDPYKNDGPFADGWYTMQILAKTTHGMGISGILHWQILVVYYGN